MTARLKAILSAALAALFVASGIAQAAVPTSTPSAASKLEQDGASVPGFALIPYLSQIQSNAAPTYGSWTLVTLNNAAGATVAAQQMVGVLETRTGAAAVTDTTDTAANIIGAIPGATIGTQTGTMTVATNTRRLFILCVASATTITIENIGSMGL